VSHLGGELRLLLIAAPGGGKGTQGELLSAHLGIQHISSGDLLRAETGADTPLGREIAAYQQRGDLVPDQVVFDVLTPVIVAAAARGGYILDGFPRTVQQATAAAEIGRRLDVMLDAAVYMYVPEPVLVRRLLARARADDTIEIIRHRLQVFSETTGPLISYYQDRGILIAVDADKPPDSIATEIESRLPSAG
jgi:adenylate kinase